MPGGHWLEKVSMFTAKGTSIRGSTSFESFGVKISWGFDPQVGWGKMKYQTSYSSHIYPKAFAAPSVTKFVPGSDFQDVINCAKFRSNPFRGLGFVRVEFWPFP